MAPSPSASPTTVREPVALETSARREGNEWIINGRKRWPGNAVWCDYIVVFARDVADKKVKAFVIEKDNPGYKATKIERKFALRCVQNADIVLTDCRVSEDARLQMQVLHRRGQGADGDTQWRCLGGGRQRDGRL